MTDDKEHREAALNRRSGMSKDAREYMAEVNAKAVWYGKCRICGAALNGAPAELVKHKHG